MEVNSCFSLYLNSEIMQYKPTSAGLQRYPLLSTLEFTMIRIMLNDSSPGLFDNIHWSWGE